MKKRIALLSMALLTIVSNAIGDNLIVSDFSIEKGETKTISLELNNTERNYILLEFFLQLPEGVRIDYDEDDYLVCELNSSRTTRTHILEMEEMENGTYKVLLYSSRNAAISGSSGEVFNFAVTASETATDGIFQGRLYKQMMVDIDKEAVYLDDFNFAITIRNFNTPGDVNGDGAVNVSDVTSLVSMILGNTPQNEVADVSGDGAVNVSDVTALVSIILGNN